MKRLVSIIFITCLFLLNCDSNKKDTIVTTEKIEVSLRQEWFPNSNYCGVIFAKEEFASRNGLKINIVPGSDNIDPVKMVISGSNDFGDASADKVLEAIGGDKPE